MTTRANETASETKAAPKVAADDQVIREKALHFAVDFSRGRHNDTVMDNAKAFYAFLKGDADV